MKVVSKLFKNGSLINAYLELFLERVVIKLRLTWLTGLKT